MSQLIFRAGKDLECMVGWDAPLETFFGQVYKTDENGRVGIEEGGMVHWVGTSHLEIRTVTELQEKLRPHVQRIPGNIRKKLALILVNQAPMKFENRPGFRLIQPDTSGVIGSISAARSHET